MNNIFKLTINSMLFSLLIGMILLPGLSSGLLSVNPRELGDTLGTSTVLPAQKENINLTTNADKFNKNPSDNEQMRLENIYQLQKELEKEDLDNLLEIIDLVEYTLSLEQQDPTQQP